MASSVVKDLSVDVLDEIAFLLLKQDQEMINRRKKASKRLTFKWKVRNEYIY